MHKYHIYIIIWFFFQVQRENPPPQQYQQLDDQQLESFIKDYDIFKSTLRVMKDEFHMTDEEYNYRFVRDIIITRFKRTGMWEYCIIDHLVNEVKDAITRKESMIQVNPTSGPSREEPMTPITTTRKSPSSSGRYTKIGGLRIVSSAVNQARRNGDTNMTATTTIPAMIAMTTTPPPKNNTITSEWADYSSKCYCYNIIIIMLTFCFK